MHISCRGPWLGKEGLIPKLGWEQGETRTNVHRGREQLSKCVYTFIGEWRGTVTTTSHLQSSLTQGSKIFLQNLPIFKKWLNFVKHCAGQAKHTFRVPGETVLTMAAPCCGSTVHVAKTCSSPLEPGAWDLPVMQSKWKTETKRDEKLNIKNLGGRSVPF